MLATAASTNISMSVIVGNTVLKYAMAPSIGNIITMTGQSATEKIQRSLFAEQSNWDLVEMKEKDNLISSRDSRLISGPYIQVGLFIKVVIKLSDLFSKKDTIQLAVCILWSVLFYSLAH